MVAPRADCVLRARAWDRSVVAERCFAVRIEERGIVVHIFPPMSPSDKTDNLVSPLNVGLTWAVVPFHITRCDVWKIAVDTPDSAGGARFTPMINPAAYCKTVFGIGVEGHGCSIL